MVLGIGEERGVQIELIPDNIWTGEEKTIRILAQDQSGNQQEITLNAIKSNHSWASSPYISATLGDDATIIIHGTTPDSVIADSSDSTGNLRLSSMGWLLPITASGTGQIVVDGQTALDYDITAYDVNYREVICNIEGASSDIKSTCNIGNGSAAFEFQALLLNDEGEVIDSSFGILPANSSGYIVNLSAEHWEPEPGMREISIRILDAKGRIVSEADRTYEIRRSDWNVGLVGLELDGQGQDQKIKILTNRLNQNLLENADCTIILSAGTHYSEHVVDMTQTFVPQPQVDRPDVEDGTEVVATIGCSFPWDIDADQTDDEARLILTGGAAVSNGISDLKTGSLSALLVIGIYVGLAWIVSNNRERERLMSITKAAIEEKRSSKISEEGPLEPEQEAPVQSEDGDGVELVGEGEGAVDEADEFEKRLRRLLDRQ